MKGRIVLMSRRFIEAATLQKIQLSGGSQRIGSDAMAAHRLIPPRTRSDTKYNRRNRKLTQVDAESLELLEVRLSGSSEVVGG